MIEKRYDCRTRHSASWYHQLITALISGVTAGLSRKDLADALNNQGLLSATGAAWTTNGVTMCLRSLRDNSDTGSYIKTAMLSLAFNGLLTRAECLCLTEPKTRECM